MMKSESEIALNDAAETGDLRVFALQLLDKAWLIGACLVVGVVLAAIYLKTATRVYEASTTVQVEQEEQKVVKVEQVMKEDLRGLEILNTIAQKLQSRPLIEAVLEQNGVLAVADQEGKPSREQTIEGFMRGGIKTSLRRNTRLIDITVRDKDPKLAATLANSIVEKYLSQDVSLSSATTKGASQFLRDEATRLQKKLEESERALQAYREQAGTVSFEQQNNTVAPRLQDLNRQLTTIRTEAVRLKTTYDDMLNMGTNVADLLAYSQISTDPAIEEIQMSIVRLKNDFALIRQRYRAKHPKYVLAANSLDGLQTQLNETVLNLRKRIRESARIAYQNAAETQKGLEGAVTTTEASALALSAQAIQFNQLSREVDSDRALFDSILGRLKETSVTSALAPERIRVIQRASTPQRPASPRVMLVLALAVFASIGLGVGMIVVHGAFDSSLHSVEDAEQFLNTTVLGVFPKLAKDEMEKTPIVATGSADSMGAEVFRSLRATLSMLGRDQDRRTFLFTSSFAQEGKTFTCVNYATSLAQQGLRTLIIDADLRRPSIEEFFTGKVDHLPGLTEWLLERAPLDKLVQPHAGVKNLFWMSAGGEVPNPSELLSQGRFPQLLAAALQSYDRVVVDTAPVQPVSDTLLIARTVQTCVLVIHGAKTPRKAAARTLQQLGTAQAPQAGVILNLVPQRKGNGYYYHHYGYGYGGYGRYGRDRRNANAKSKTVPVA